MVPGVTSILADAGLRESFFDNEWYADKGTKIHLALHYLDTVGLNYESIDEQILPYIESYEEWKLTSNVEILESEYIVFNEAMGYGCIIDKIARFDLLGKVVHGIVEVKSGQAQKSDHIQTAGQTLAIGTGPWVFAQKEPCPKYVIKEYGYMRRWLLYIYPKGFRFFECTEQMDLDVFHAGTTIYNWKRRV